MSPGGGERAAVCSAGSGTPAACLPRCLSSSSFYFSFFVGFFLPVLQAAAKMTKKPSA